MKISLILKEKGVSSGWGCGGGGRPEPAGWTLSFVELFGFFLCLFYIKCRGIFGVINTMLCNYCFFFILHRL